MFAHDLMPTPTSRSLPLKLAELANDLAPRLAQANVAMTLTLRARTLHVAFDHRAHVAGPPLVEIFLAAFNESDWQSIDGFTFEGCVFGAAAAAWTYAAPYPLSYAPTPLASPSRRLPRRRRSRLATLSRVATALAVVLALVVGPRRSHARWAPLAASARSAQVTLTRRWQSLQRRAEAHLTRRKTMPRRSAAGVEPFKAPTTMGPPP